MPSRQAQPFALFAAAWLIFAATMLLGIAPLVPAGYRAVCWGSITLTAVPLLFWGAELGSGSARRRKQSQSLRRQLAAAHNLAAERVTERLRRIHQSFAPEQLRAEADRLRRVLRDSGTGKGSRADWLRLLSIEGCGSGSWWGLSESLLSIGEVDGAIRAGAEALRVGAIEPDQLLTLAEQAMGTEHDAWVPGRALRPHGLTALALNAEVLAPGQVAELYQLLARAGLPRTVELVLWRELLAVTGDREEASRQRDRLAGAVEPDLAFARQLRDGWAGYRSGDNPLAEPDSTYADDGESWVDHVPPRWRAALGMEPWVYVDPPVRHRASLPVYALSDSGDLLSMADKLLELTAEPVSGRIAGDQSPAIVQAQIRARLWPRAKRSRSAISELLAILAPMKSPGHVSAGLVVIGEALGEETDPRLADLRCDLERIVRLLPDEATLAPALEAVGRAWAPVDPPQAIRLWTEAADLARRLDPGAARARLASFVSGWLTETRRPDLGANAAAILNLAVAAAIDSRDGAALSETLLAVSAQPAGPARDELRRQLAALSNTWPSRFLAGWGERNVVAMAAAAEKLWADSLETWHWTAAALASAARPGDEVVLRPLLDPLRRGAKGSARDGASGGDERAVAAWLVLAYAVDRIEERPGRPEARRALDAMMALPPARLGPALVALRTTLTRPESRWLEAVEAGLLRRLSGNARIDAEALHRVEAIADVLPPARLQAHLDRWIGQWSADLTAFGRSIWDVQTR